jgi:chromosome partitioning protein
MCAVRRTAAVLNQKGGVGKTTVTLGLASAAAAVGRRVLVVDLDPQASSTWVLGIDPTTHRPTVADLIGPKRGRVEPRSVVTPSAWSDRVDVLPASSDLLHLESGKPRRLRRALEVLEDDYEAVLIDCPPSLGNLTRSALTAAAYAVIVVEPSALGLRGIGGVADAVDDVWDGDNPDLELAGVILNRVPAVSNESERRIDELTRIVGRDAIWSPPVPQRVVLNQAVGDRRPVHSYGSRAVEAAAAFDALWVRLRTVIHSRT